MPLTKNKTLLKARQIKKQHVYIITPKRVTYHYACNHDEQTPRNLIISSLRSRFLKITTHTNTAVESWRYPVWPHRAST